MPRTLCPVSSPRYRPLFPDWKKPQPIGFFFLENLLEARRASTFPTNTEGPDEDVNVYLAALLTALFRDTYDPRIVSNCGPLWNPPPKSLGHRSQAEWYRVNGDQRLTYLGLFDRGDGLRRSINVFGLNRTQTWEQDLETGRSCYELAANLLDNRKTGNPALVAVMRKLARNFDQYVHVLSTLATRRLGLGARLSDAQLHHMLRPDPSAPPNSARGDFEKKLPAAAMDDLLDGLLRYRRRPEQDLKQQLSALAETLGISEEKLFGEQASEGVD